MIEVIRLTSPTYDTLKFTFTASPGVQLPAVFIVLLDNHFSSFEHRFFKILPIFLSQVICHFLITFVGIYYITVPDSFIHLFQKSYSYLWSYFHFKMYFVKHAVFILEVKFSNIFLHVFSFLLLSLKLFTHLPCSQQRHANQKTPRERWFQMGM